MRREDVNILLIDDANTILLQVKELLIVSGFRNITTAKSAEEAAVLLFANNYHLILSDWHMGTLSGLGFLKYVRENPETKKIVFVMMTAEGTKDLVMEAIACGVNDYLIKPLSLLDIETRLCKTL